MSADRRTLAVAAVAMVVLVGVGVVSASIFTRSACEGLTLNPVPAATSGGDVDAVLEEALADVDEEVVGRTVERLESLAGGQPLPSGIGGSGHLMGAADVGPARQLTGLGGGLAATGQRITATSGPHAEPTAVELDEPARVVGDGGHLYALAIGNEVTGQVDGMVALNAGLDGGECLDTARVGVRLPFHLDAADGQLLLLRVEDDGEDPEIEVRGADGSMWSEPDELGPSPPGALAERLTGRLDGDLVVTARSPVTDDDAPALTVRDRGNGAVRWEHSAVDLDGLAPAGEQPLEVETVDVTDELVLVALSREEQAPVLLVALARDDGRPVWTSDLDAQGVPRAVGTIGGDIVLLSPRDVVDADAEERTFEVARLAAEDGTVRTLYSASGDRASAVLVDSRVVLAVDGEVVRVDPDGQAHAVSVPLPVRDLHTVAGRVALLVRSSEGGAIVWARL